MSRLENASAFLSNARSLIGRRQFCIGGGHSAKE
jgi:hypothetical protein